MIKPKKIIITGAGGYIGSNAVYLFLQHGYEIVAIDNFSRGYKQPLELLQKKFTNEQFRFYNYDLTADISGVFHKEKNIDAVIHYAALCDINESLVFPQKYFFNNVYGLLNLLDFMGKNDIQKIIFSSSCAVYGKTTNLPVNETHPSSPLNPYSKSKFVCERLLEWYGTNKMLQFVILRYFNVTGASDDGLLGDSKKPSSLLIQNAVRGALGIEPFSLTCNVVENKDNSPIRDFININDLNNAHLKALLYLQNGGTNNAFNIGTGQGYSVLEVIKTVEKMTGKKIPLNRTKPRKNEVPCMIASNNKAKKLLGWQNKHDLHDSIKSLITWYKSRPNGWDY